MLNDISILREELLKTFIIHLPHASFNLPRNDDFLISGSKLQKELLSSADIEIDSIFNIPEIEKHVCDFSRVFCDVEKLLKYEVRDIDGRGIFYTKTINGNDLREFNHSKYWDVITNYYIPYHKHMYDKVLSILEKEGVVRIIDAHSFNGFDSNIDICIGYDDYHTPKYLLEYVVQFFQSNGYVVELNNPYSGTYVPMPYFQNNGNVQSIMIEINKKLYCNTKGIPIKEMVIEFNDIIKEMLEFS
ncbi:N-formylglutamate amidohydrolase [Candidatus Dojkabacteria bacterium]|jgi:N-formylglutamate amidohydrolase|nr:N-formylglutamate amidohydrolase [Candidatus Dojkabacteria bacterium]